MLLIRVARKVHIEQSFHIILSLDNKSYLKCTNKWRAAHEFGLYFLTIRIQVSAFLVQLIEPLVSQAEVHVVDNMGPTFYLLIHAGSLPPQPSSFINILLQLFWYYCLNFNTFIIKHKHPKIIIITVNPIFMR